MTHSNRSYVERNAARKKIRRKVGERTMLYVAQLEEKDADMVGRLVDR